VTGICRAVVSGLGIGSIPNFMVEETTDLVRVLPEISGPTIEAYFVYPEELRPSKRISVFRDFLIRKVQEARLV
jgi:DNA-binding transcriptional LysR family regulator